jgi:hypothetical protein
LGLLPLRNSANGRGFDGARFYGEFFLWLAPAPEWQNTAPIDNTARTTPLNANFSGCNDAVVFPAEYLDYRLNNLATQLSPGPCAIPAAASATRSTGKPDSWRRHGQREAKLERFMVRGFAAIYRVLELALYHSLGKLPEAELTHRFF